MLVYLRANGGWACNDCEIVCGLGFGLGEDRESSVIAYDDRLGQRLPMTAFEQLLLNETSGKCCLGEYCDCTSLVL